MVFSNNLLLGAGGQSTGPASFDTTLIGNSVWLDGSADGFTKPASEFDAEDGKEFTLGTWFQLTEFGVAGALFCAGNGSGVYTSLRHAADNKIYLQTEAGSHILSTTAVFRDVAWYHVLVSVDTTQVANTSRVRMFINGVETALTGTYPALNHAYDFNLANVHEVGDSYENGAFEGYLAQSFMIGTKSIQQGDFAITDFLDSFTFGTNGSQHIPKKNSEIKTLVDSGSDNSFLLNFEPADPTASNALGLDISTYGNNFTSTNIAAANQSTNTPSKNYAVMDVLKNDGANTSTMVFSEGNTRVTGTGGSDGGAFSTLSLPTSGTTEFQATFNNGDGVVGICCYDNLEAISSSSSRNVTGGLGVNYNAAYGYQENGEKVVQLSSGVTRSTQGAALTTNSVVTVRYDADSNEITFLKDNVVQGSAVSTVAGLTYYAFVARFNNYDITLHFDSADFPHTIGSGNKTIDTANLSAPTYQGIDYFAPTLYEGNGTGQRVGDFVPFTDAYTVTNSVLFDDGDARSLQLNPSDSATSSTVAAFSLWTKRANLGTDQRPLTVHVDGNNYFSIYYNTSDQLDFTINQAGSTILQRVTARTFKDTSAWHNIVVIINQGNGTQADRVKVFYDGVQIPNTSAGFGTNTCTLDGSSALNFLNDSSSVFDIGGGRFSQHYDGYIAEAVFLDGADSGNKIDATPFGQVDTSTNRWVAKDPGSYTFGNMGYYLEFKVASGTGSGAGTDTSGESNNFTETGSGWATSDQFVGNPSANYATLNRIIPPTPSHSTGGNATMSEGNLKWDVAASTNANSSFQTTSLAFQIQDGKWYYELESVDSAGGNLLTGLVDMQNFQAAGSFISDAVDGQIAYGIAGSSSTTDTIYTNTTTLSGSDSPLNGADDIDNGDVLGVYIEKSKDTYNFWFSRNGTMLVRDTSGLPIISYSRSAPMCVFVRSTNATTKECALNFGQQMVFDGGATTASAATGGRWKHVPTNTAYKALNVDNLDDTASKITAWAWIKNRDATDNHMLFDRVRGVSKDMHSNDTAAEVTNTNTVQRFLQRGVQIGSDVEVNTANESYVLWQWLLGDSATTGSSITAGSPSLATTGIVADADHFSVLSYTGNATSGATIAHGMSAAPEMIWIKERDNANGWIVGSDVVGYTKILRLDTTDAEGTDSGAFNDTAPSATLITLGSNNGTNRSSGQMICYAFRSVFGVCKVGSYVGNLNDNGPYVSTGFKPSYIMIKSTTTARDWVVFDTSRDPINLSDHRLDPSNTGAEFNAALDLDILSDGFKFRSDDIDGNASGVKYIYLAMADIGGNGTLPPVYGR